MAVQEQTKYDIKYLLALVSKWCMFNFELQNYCTNEVSQKQIVIIKTFPY